MILNKDRSVTDMILVEDMKEDQLKAEIQYMAKNMGNSLMDALQVAIEELHKRFEASDFDMLLYFESLIIVGFEWPEAEFRTREKLGINNNKDWQDLVKLYDSDFYDWLYESENN